MDSISQNDYAEPIFLCKMPSTGKYAISEALSFMRIARNKAPFPAGAYISQKVSDETVEMSAVYNPSVTGAKAWAEYMVQASVEILEEVSKCGNMRRRL